LQTPLKTDSLRTKKLKEWSSTLKVAMTFTYGVTDAGVEFIKRFASGQDIHKMTANKTQHPVGQTVFGVLTTIEQRRYMLMMFSEEQILKIEQEFKQWQEFLNFILGMFCFNASIACLGLKSPQVFGWISLIFFFIAGCLGASKFPESYKALRDKLDKTKQEEIWYFGIRSKFLGVIPFLKGYTLYLIGIIFLATVANGIITNR